MLQHIFCLFVLGCYVGCTKVLPAGPAAHRGVGAAGPDNSRAAIITAIKEQVPFVELDFRRNGEGHLYLWHDRKVQFADQVALIGRPFRTLTDAETKSLTVDGHPILSAREAFLLVKGSSTLLQLDLKDETLETIDEIVALARKMGVERNILVQCQGWDCAQTMVSRYADVAWLARVHNPDDFLPLLNLNPFVVQVDPSESLVTQSERAHSRGVSLLVKSVGATLDKASCWCCLRGRGVDIVLTDRPLEYVKVLGRGCPEDTDVNCLACGESQEGE